MTAPDHDSLRFIHLEAGPVMVLRRDDLLRSLVVTTGDYVAVAAAFEASDSEESDFSDCHFSLLWSGDDIHRITGAEMNARLDGRHIQVMTAVLCPVILCVKAARGFE